MPALSGAQQTALEQRAVMRRIFVECDALDPDTGDPAPGRFWDDVGTKLVDGKTFYGSGTLGEAATISGTSDLSITPLVLTLSGIAPEVALLVRGSTVAQRPIRMWFGIYDTETNALVGSLVKVFEGYVDDIEITTPESGGLSTIVVTCESISRELTIRNTDTRSHDSQRARSATDDFFKFVDSMASKHVYFGSSEPRRHKKNKRR